MSTTRSRSGSTRAMPAAAIASPCRRRQQPRRCRWRQQPTRSSRVDRDFRRTAGVAAGRRERPAEGSALMSVNTMGTSFGTRLHASLSPRLLLSELLLKQWFEPVIPFTLLIALLLWFSATIPNYAGLREFSVADAALRRVRLRRHRHGVLPDHRRHRSQRRRHVRALQFHRPVPAQRGRAAGSAGHPRHAWRSARRSAASTAC